MGRGCAPAYQPPEEEVAEMPEMPEASGMTDELRKLADIATDMQLFTKMRMQAIDQLGELASHEALLVLLNLAANDKLPTDERDQALKKAREIVKKGR
jgi:hypothetical protein